MMRRITILSSILVVLVLIQSSSIWLIIAQDVKSSSIEEAGDLSCPCLTSLEQFPIDQLDYNVARMKLGTSIAATNYSSYGIGCHAHDIGTPQCILPKKCSSNANTLPRQIHCDYSWCNRSWCFVDHKNCQLLNRLSTVFPDSERYVSYATCGYADAHTRNNRFSDVEDRVYRVGINSNSGGWKGSYSSDKQHFKGPESKWGGPLITFVNEAARIGRFSYVITEPPDSLRNKSIEYLNGTDFDFCIYTAALGYVDMCIAQYTITEQRALSTNFLQLGYDGLYLIAMDDSFYASRWESFLHSVGTIFRPFTMDSWLFILFFVIPVLGCLMIVHEQGNMSSTFPREETVIVRMRNGSEYARKQKIPYRNTIIKAIYVTLLAVLQASYEQSVVTVGAMLNLLGISFFILTIIAVYTANLAAILTQSVQRTSVKDFEDAIRMGYRICVERKNMKVVTALYPNQNLDHYFVKDPVYLGGDANPGFACEQCSSRVRTFDMVNPQKANFDENYCHASIAPLEDLELLQASGLHCNKTAIGIPIRSVSLGFPIFQQNEPSLSSFFTKMKSDGIYDKILLDSKPDRSCFHHETGEGSSLSVSQLSGIWTVSFTFAIVGLIHTFLSRVYKKQIRNKQYSVYQVHQRDQKGTRIESFNRDPSWVSSRLDCDNVANACATVADSINPTQLDDDCEDSITKENSSFGRKSVSFNLNGSTDFLHSIERIQNETQQESSEGTVEFQSKDVVDAKQQPAPRIIVLSDDEIDDKEECTIPVFTTP
jgi:Ligand-gated ion channel